MRTDSASMSERLRMPLTTRRFKQTRVKETAAVPWDPLVPVLLLLLRRSVEARGTQEARDTAAHFLVACLVVCREASQLVLREESAKYILLYERWRLHPPTGDIVPFLEMWPLYVYDGGPLCGDATPDHRAVRQLDVESVVSDRMSCIKVLETTTTDLKAMQSRFCASGMPFGVPLSVCIFVGRARFLYHALASEHELPTCRVCSRPCFFNYSDEYSTSANDELDGIVKDAHHAASCESQREYWAMCGGTTPLVSLRDSQCCSNACLANMQREVDTAMGVSADELFRHDASEEKSGSSRLPAAMRAAMRRNGVAARRMRAAENHLYTTLTRMEVRYFRSMACAMLNVDLTLLYAASHLAESPPMMAGRIIPPLTVNWRSIPSLCGGSVSACRRFYQAHFCAGAKSETLIPSVVGDTRYLCKCRDRAVAFF